MSDNRYTTRPVLEVMTDEGVDAMLRDLEAMLVAACKAHRPDAEDQRAILAEIAGTADELAFELNRIAETPVPRPERFAKPKGKKARRKS